MKNKIKENESEATKTVDKRTLSYPCDLNLVGKDNA